MLTQARIRHFVETGTLECKGAILPTVNVRCSAGWKEAVLIPCTVPFHLLDNDFPRYVADALNDLAEIDEDFYRKTPPVLVIHKVLHEIFERPSPYFRMPLFQDREDKNEKSVDFLKRIHACELRDGSLTMAALKKLDRKLWDALRQWGRRPGNRLGDIIKPGIAKMGRPLLDTEESLAKLDPTNEDDAVAIDLAEVRKKQREARQLYRAVKSRNPVRPETIGTSQMERLTP